MTFLSHVTRLLANLCDCKFPAWQILMEIVYKLLTALKRLIEQTDVDVSVILCKWKFLIKCWLKKAAVKLKLQIVFMQISFQGILTVLLAVSVFAFERCTQNGVIFFLSLPWYSRLISKKNYIICESFSSLHFEAVLISLLFNI